MLFQKQLVVILFCVSINTFAGNGIKLAFSGGYGSLSGNIPDYTVFALSSSIQFPSYLLNDTDLNLEFVWAKNSSSLFPSNIKKYYSYIYGLLLTAVIKQNIGEKYFLEESAGYLFMVDNTYDYVSYYNSGINLNAAIGLNTSKKNPQSNAILFGFNYGLTFTNNNTSFIITYIKYKIAL